MMADWQPMMGHWPGADRVIAVVGDGLVPVGLVSATEAILAMVGVLAAVLFGLNLYRLWHYSRSILRAKSFWDAAKQSGEALFEVDVESRRLDWVSPPDIERLACEDGSGLQFGTNTGLIHPDEHDAVEAGWNALSWGEPLDIQLRLRDSGGGWCWFHLHAAPVLDAKGRCRHALGVLRCTDELHQTQEELAEARRLETVGTIAGGIAHEFNNHLTPVRGYIELALDDLGPDHPAADGLRTALDRVVHCSDLVSQIQAYGRKSLLDLRPMDVVELLPAVVRIAMSFDRPHSNRVTIEEEWPDSLPEVNLDKTQFQQGLLQLLRNAYDAMPRGGTLRVEAREVFLQKVECSAHRDAIPGHFVRLRVSDTGVGISKEHLTHVFDPFFTTHGRAQARGMGLSMAQGMMAQHGGWMQIQSEKGQGTCIDLYFPASAPLAETILSAPIGTPDHVELAESHHGRLLIADDDPFVREIVKAVFKGEEWSIDEVEDFHQVRERFGPDAPAYDIALLDISMPGPPVEDAVRHIVSSCEGVRILLTSGFARNSRIEALMMGDGVEYIAKPFSTKELKGKVDQLLPVPS